MSEDRYRVEKTGRGFWPYCVRTGDGLRELFIGHKKQCAAVAAELATAFEDGRFVAEQSSGMREGDLVKDDDFVLVSRGLLGAECASDTVDGVDVAMDAAMAQQQALQWCEEHPRFCHHADCTDRAILGYSVCKLHLTALKEIEALAQRQEGTKP